ncbi:TPC10-like protein [Mya arenaria]|uniref:TPC10-like protein n=1 Tax=Mya arenaria TaxID=6604 RepID=A0ABY7EDI2_MYAAR|nr:TPC10-like protein [Mya arenaria]
MEAKPIVTTHGNQVVFSSLLKPLLEDLPKETAEWRRSYGRTARNVNLEASFVPYDDDILPDDSVKTLVSRLYFHIYWTDCDLEAYKQTVKEEITEWQAALKAKNIPDWLIVVVNSDESKAKTKLLPRSSVFDKIKSDFCGKQPERVVLLEPHREEKRSAELWNSFLTRLRQLLLQAFARHLQKYEDNMRALREKRNDIGWNFQKYFIVQEELAFMFEMLGLHEDALIQYDELDALFTQFVLNHASGQSVPWLSSLVKPCTCWAGLSLQRPISWERRNTIKDNEAALLDFRNYLFSRQCALLLLLNKPGEIVQRAIDYLHETVQEMKTLEVCICEGGLDCWVYLSGLEVLLKCGQLEDPVNSRSQALNTAYLWDYVCRKLHTLGELCGLMPGLEQPPTSKQLDQVVDLTSGMGLHIPTEHEHVEEQLTSSPRDKLREALSSREAFQNIYLEQSELAMGTFKHIGRFRSARMIGKNLADFYMKLGEPQKAENFLLDAMSSYHKEGWKKLRDVSRLHLATCQLRVNKHKYVKTGCQVASSAQIDLDQRLEHIHNVLDIAKTVQGTVLLKASPLFKLDIKSVSLPEVSVGETFTITATIYNNAPCDLSCDSIWLTLTDCIQDYSGKRKDNLKDPVTRQTSNSSLDSRFVMNSPNIKKEKPFEITLRSHFEGTPDETVSTGIACMNSHELLRRNDSSGGVLAPVEEKVTKDMTSQRSCVKDVKLEQGTNELMFTFENITVGQYEVGQAGFKIGNLEFIKALGPGHTVSVICDDTCCDILPESTMIAGVMQKVRVCLHSGNTNIDANSKVRVSSADDLAVETGCHDNTVLLGEVVRGGTSEWTMSLLQQPHVYDEEEIENKVIFDCSWLPRPLLTSVTFKNPFKVTHRLFTARDMKYLQMSVSGQTDREFVLGEWSLVVSGNNDVDLVCLNKTGQPVIKSNMSECPPMNMTFSFSYSCPEAHENESRKLSYSFTLNSFQTILTVRADVSPAEDNKVCKTGCHGSLKIQVTQMPGHKPLTDQELMYEVDGQAHWRVLGISAGVFSLSGGSYQTFVDVVPVTSGFLPLPLVHLYKYSGPSVPEKKSSQAEEDEQLSTTDEESSGSEEDGGPQHMEFEPGQVYYSCQGRQVHVYPVDVSGELEVALIH